jgi:NADH-quinone oxidoreductase subunit N
MTIAMLSLAGIPATAGFVGKVYLIDASVDGGYTWLAVVIVVGSMISLAYYLRVVAAMWMRPAAEAPAPPPTAGVDARPAIAGGSPEADAPPRAGRQLEVTLVAVACGAASIFFGIVPSPLFDLVRSAGSALGNLF